MTKALDHGSRGSTLSMHLEAWETKAKVFWFWAGSYHTTASLLHVAELLLRAFIGIRGFDINTLSINNIPIFLPAQNPT